MLETPVLFIIFNRPDLERQVLERIREVKPKQLFVVADGPRLNRPDDIEKCKKAREVIDELVDWDCELHKNYSDENLGCRERVSSGITWFFEHVEEGIILEDDCLPSDSAFEYLENKLNFYKNDHSIGSITLVNRLKTQIYFTNDSYLSKYAGIWGWATWADRWAESTRLIFDENKLRQTILGKFKTALEKDFNNHVLAKTFSKKYDSWGFYWRFYHIVNSKYCIRPKVNLVENIGFNNDATHTLTADKSFTNLKLDLNRVINNRLRYCSFIDYVHVADKINMSSYKYRILIKLFNFMNFILRLY